MSHAQLGDDNLLIVPGSTHGVLEVEADHLVLALGKELLHSLDRDLHQDWIVRVHNLEGLPPRVGVHYVMRGELPAVFCHRPLGAPLEPRGAPLEPLDVLSVCVLVGVLIVTCEM